MGGAHFSWLRQSGDGVTATERLIRWMDKAYKRYQSCGQVDKKRMLQRLVREMQRNGHGGCSAAVIRSKFASFRKQLRGVKHHSQDFLQFQDILKKLLAEEIKDKTLEQPVATTAKSVKTRPVKNKHSAKTKKRSSRSVEEKAWDLPPCSGGLSPMVQLVAWLKKSYPVYKKLTAGKQHFLIQLQHEMEKVGNKGFSACLIQQHIVRLERQFLGYEKPSKLFNAYRSQLQGIFSSKERGVQQVTACTKPSQAETRQNTGRRSLSLPSAQNAKDGELPDKTLSLTKTSCGPNSSSLTPPSCVELSSSETEDEDDCDVAIVGPNVAETVEEISSIQKKQLSKEEIERISTLLTERDRLERQGIAQEVIDKYLPLP